MAAHKLQFVIDAPRAALVFEMLNRDVINVALAQVVERCNHYEKLDIHAEPAKGKKSKRPGIEITAPDGTKIGTVRVTPQLLATAFSETFRSVRNAMRCNSQHDFLFYMHGTNIVGTDGTRYTLAVDGNRFILKMNSLPLRDVLAKKLDVLKPAPSFPKIARNDVGDLTPATKRAFRDLWNSLLESAKEPLASISENCMLKTPRYLANVTRVELWFGKGRDTQQFGVAYVAKGADDFEPRTLGKHFPLTAEGIAAALHSLRVRCPMPSGNVAAKPPKGEKADKKPDAKPVKKAAPKAGSKKASVEPKAAKPAAAPAVDAPAASTPSTAQQDNA